MRSRAPPGGAENSAFAKSGFTAPSQKHALCEERRCTPSRACASLRTVGQGTSQEGRGRDGEGQGRNGEAVVRGVLLPSQHAVRAEPRRAVPDVPSRPSGRAQAAPTDAAGLSPGAPPSVPSQKATRLPSVKSVGRSIGPSRATWASRLIHTSSSSITTRSEADAAIPARS